MATLERKVRFLQAYCGLTTLVLAALMLSGFASHGQRQRFDEIDVERLNLVDGQGHIQMVIANSDRLPGPGNIVTGKFGKRTGLQLPGVLFYNAKGDEAGGLIFGSKEENGKYMAGAHMAFDNYNGDQVIGFNYNGVNSGREVGFHVWDQPDVTVEEQGKNWDAARKLPPGAERDALLQQAVGAKRVFIGRLRDKSANVTLFDANSRPRLRMVVTSNGDAKLEFLDASGKVVQSLPGTTER